MDALKELPQAKVVELAMMSLVADADPDDMMNMAYIGALLVKMAVIADELFTLHVASQMSALPDLSKAIFGLQTTMVDIYPAAFDMVKEEFIEE